MEFLDVVAFALFRVCELTGAAIFALRLRGTKSGILGVVGFLGLFVSAVGQRIAYSVFEFSTAIWATGLIAEIVAFSLILLAIWLVPGRAEGRPARTT